MKQKVFFSTTIFLISITIFLFNPFSASDAKIDLGNNSGVTIIMVTPPDIFNLPGSETTNFIQVCSLGEALNIILDVVGKNKIEFKDPIVDMCDNETIEKLDQYIQLDKVGEVTIDSDALPYLKEKSALITMKNLSFEEEPNIEIDGKLATDQDIVNKNWDKSSKTLTFEAKHFSTYKAVAKTIEHSEQNRVLKFDDNLKIIIIGFISIIVVLVVYLIWKRK